MPRARLGAPVAKYKTKNFQQRSVLSVIALAGASRGTGFVQLCRHRLTNNSMGFLQKLLDFLGLSGQKVNVLVVGLDSSGKTTTIERLKPKHRQVVDVAPTVGFNVEEFQRGGLKFTVFDMSGAGRYRMLWEHYYRETQAVIFVLDSADTLRLVVAKDELDNLLANHHLGKRVPMLFLANKMDLPTALAPVELAQALHLEALQERPWQIAPTNGLTGDGLDKAMEWLADRLMRS